MSETETIQKHEETKQSLSQGQDDTGYVYQNDVLTKMIRMLEKENVSEVHNIKKELSKI